MVTLDEKKIAKQKTAELIGYLCIAVAVAGGVFFAVCYPIARVKDLHTLLILSYTLAPALIVLGSAGEAFCNIKYGGKGDKLIRKYI